MKPFFLLEPDGKRWRVARIAGDRVDLQEVSADDGTTESLRTALEKWGYRGQGVCLSLPSDMVFSAQIDCNALPGKQRRSAMLYRLEEQLPVDIERLTADFLPAAGGRALGVAVETARMRDLVGQLASAGIQTAAICATALLALWNARKNCAEESYAILAESGKVDIFRMHDGLPASWYAVSDDAREVVRCIQADNLAHPFDAEQTTCLIADADWPASAALSSELGLRIEHAGQAPLATAARAAGQLLAGEQAGWVNLRRDALAIANPWGAFRGLVRLALALGFALLAAMTAAFCWRGLAYGARADEAVRRQVEVYSRLHPGRSVPTGIKRRLRSELRRLAGLGGVAAEVPRQASALDALRRIAANLPAGVPVRILELRVGQDGVYIEGQTRTHSDAEVIKRSLSASGFDIEPPHTETLAVGGVSFTLAGKPRSEPGAGGKEEVEQ